MGIIQSDRASLTNILWDWAHRWLMYSRGGFLFVPDLQHFGRSVDSNKGLLNNRFHSPTQEGPAWPRGVSCSFEHLNPPCKRLTSLCYSLVDVPSLCFRALCGSGKAPVDRARGAFSCKRSSHWDHQAPVNWTFTYLRRSSERTYCFNEECISRRWGARFNEPLPGLEIRDMKQTVCSQPQTSAALSCLLLWTHASSFCCLLKPVQRFSAELHAVNLHLFAREGRYVFVIIRWGLCMNEFQYNPRRSFIRTNVVALPMLPFFSK